MVSVEVIEQRMAMSVLAIISESVQSVNNALI